MFPPFLPFLQVKPGFVSMHFLCFPCFVFSSGTCDRNCAMIKVPKSSIIWTPYLPITCWQDILSGQPEEEIHRLLNSKSPSAEHFGKGGIATFDSQRMCHLLSLVTQSTLPHGQGDPLVWDAMWAVWPEKRRVDSGSWGVFGLWAPKKMRHN